MSRASKRSRAHSPRATAGVTAPHGASPGRAIYWALAVGLSAVLVYLNAPGHEFVLDDTRLIRDNIRIRSLANIPSLFASPYWDLEGAQALYRPLVHVTFAANYALHGLATHGYAVVNIALHTAVSLLLFWLVRGLGASLFAAGVAGIAFAVHPVHTEAVTGMAGRPELLAALFFLIAMWCHRKAGAPGASLWYRAGTMAAFACALLSKESAITLLLVLPVMDALFPDRASDGPAEGLRRRILDYGLLGAVALAYLAARSSVLGGILVPVDTIAPLDNPLVPLTTLPLGEQLGATKAQAIMTAFAVVAEYARLMVWPARLSPDYSFNQIPIVTSVLDVRFLVGVLMVAGVLAGIVALWRRSPVAAFGLAFSALTFSVVSNFAITIGTICAERLLYLPSAGLIIAAAVGVERLARTMPAHRWLVYAGLLVLAVCAGLRTWTRNDDWATEVTLWTAALATSPESARVQSENGRVLLSRAEQEAQAGRPSDAERTFGQARTHFERALAIHPSYSPPMDGLATIHAVHQQYDAAHELFERAVKAQPSNFAALANWGGLLWEQSARAAAQAAVYREQGRLAESEALGRQADAGFRDAMEKIDRALAIQPSYAHAHLMRGLILDDHRGDRAGAIAEFEEVLRLMPNHPQRAVIEQKLAELRAVTS